MKKVFISHAVADKELASAFEELLENGIGLQHHEVFCTSLEGQGIPSGRDFKSFIKQELEGAEVVIALITTNYYASVFCNCELGATWIESKEFIPILVDPVDYNDLRGTLSGTQCLRLKDPSSLNEVYDKLKHVVEHPAPVAKWSIKKTNFETKLGGILASLKQPPLVKREELDAMTKQRDEFKALATTQDAEISNLKDQIIQISALKDKKEVAAIKAQHSSEWEHFEELRQDAQKSVKALPSIIREALYYWVRGQSFEPDQGWEESTIRDAIEEDMLEPASDDIGYRVNTDRPEIARAIENLRALREFLDETSSVEFTEEFNQRYGDTPNIARKSMWSKLVKP
jgi:hypothetical protein